VADPISFWDAVYEIRRTDDSYAEEAYAFVMDALEYAVRSAGERRHVSGAELSAAACDFAKQRFGVLAWTVLEQWGVWRTSDIGTIVYQLIAAGVLSRQESDSRADFDDLFDLKVVLEDQYFDRGPIPGARDSA